MEIKTIQCKFGTLKIIEKIRYISKILCYVCRNDKRMYLCKVYKFPENESLYIRELETVKSISDSEFIIKLLDETRSIDSGTLVYDYTELICLSSFLQGSNSIDSHLLIHNIVNCLSRLHSLNIIHANLTTEVIFITKTFAVKLGGFEYSTNSEELLELYDKNQEIPIKQFFECQAPEFLDSGFTITAKIDMWSLGCVIYNILCRDTPFPTLESQKKGVFKDKLEGVWKIVIKRLLVVDPRVRGTCRHILAILEADREGINKSFSNFSGFFKKSTSSWVKELTHDIDTYMDRTIFDKILLKSKTKPYKIIKFYNALNKRPLYKPKTCLKCLLLLNNYLFFGPTEVYTQKALTFLDNVILIWTKYEVKSRQKYFSGTSRQLILEYSNILHEKYRIHKDNSFPGNWLIPQNLEIKQTAEIINYYGSISRFAPMIFSLNDLADIYLDVMKILISEQQQINLLLAKNFSDSTSPDILEEYSDIYGKNINFLSQFCLKYPLVDIDMTLSPSQSLFNKRNNEKINASSEFSLSNVSSLSSLSSCLSNSLVSISSEIDSNKHEETPIALISDLEFKEIIGTGGSCTVYRGLYKQKLVAIKEMKQNLNKTSFMKEFNREIQTLSKLKHPNLVMLLGASIGSKCCIITDYCAGKSLFNLLYERREVKLSWKQRFKFARDIAEGMAYLHSVHPPVLHRDLKSLNLLLTEEINTPEDSSTVKITDFGVSRVLTEETMTGKIGTSHWMAPEIFNDLPYGLPSDVYSYGIVLWEILTRETPYKGVNPANIPYQVSLGKRPDVSAIASSCPSKLKEIMVECWNSNPALRPTFNNIVERLGMD